MSHNRQTKSQIRFTQPLPFMRRSFERPLCTASTAPAVLHAALLVSFSIIEQGKKNLLPYWYPSVSWNRGKKILFGEKRTGFELFHSFAQFQHIINMFFWLLHTHIQCIVQQIGRTVLTDQCAKQKSDH